MLRPSCMGVSVSGGRSQEFPSIRFRASKPVGDDPGSGLETQALVSQRVALELDERLRQFQQAGQLPSTQTCDLIIVDRCAGTATGCQPATEVCQCWGGWFSGRAERRQAEAVLLRVLCSLSLGTIKEHRYVRRTNCACLVKGL